MGKSYTVGSGRGMYFLGSRMQLLGLGGVPVLIASHHPNPDPWILLNVADLSSADRSSQGGKSWDWGPDGQEAAEVVG